MAIAGALLIEEYKEKNIQPTLSNGKVNQMFYFNFYQSVLCTSYMSIVQYVWVLDYNLCLQIKILVLQKSNRLLLL